MKILSRLSIAVVFAAVFLMTGCAGKPIRVGPVDQQMERTNVDFTKGRTISASASGFQLLLFIPININDRHESAYNILRGQAGNDYIADVQIQESWTYAFVGTVYTTTIKAMAYPRKTKS